MIRIASVSELPDEGEAREFAAGDMVICVVNINGEYRAMDNTCPHRGGALGQGVVEGRHIVCPWHGWQFDTETGRSLQNSHLGVKLYHLKIFEDQAYLELQ